jgi:hypothetical protein
LGSLVKKNALFIAEANKSVASRPSAHSAIARGVLMDAKNSSGVFIGKSV